MARILQHKQASVGRAGEGVRGAVPGDGGQPMAAHLSIRDVSLFVDVVVYRGGDAWWGNVFAYISEGIGLGFAAMSLVGAGFAAIWVASGVYLGRAFHRREQGVEESARAEAAPAARRETVAEQRT